jgi:hypothetical protein
MEGWQRLVIVAVVTEIFAPLRLGQTAYARTVTDTRKGAGHPTNSGYIEAIISESRDPTVDALAIERGFSDCNPVLSSHEIDRFFAIRTGHGPSAHKPRD